MHRRHFGLLAAAALMFAPAVGLAWSPVSDAIADSRRPAADKERDARSKPAEILTFAGVKPGDHVADLVMGGGYYTRLFAGVVGPNGKVFAWQPGEFIAMMPKYGEAPAQLPASYPNLSTSTARFPELALPGSLDVVFTNQNYHDFHLPMAPAGTAEAVNAKVFAALKPGGAYVIIDHHAAAGADVTEAADKLHRIDIEAVKREVTAAGFVLEAEADLLRNPADPRTAIVFDPGVRGKTDQFILRFRKPA